jgi:hypothetical protein
MASKDEESIFDADDDHDKGSKDSSDDSSSGDSSDSSADSSDDSEDSEDSGEMFGAENKGDPKGVIAEVASDLADLGLQVPTNTDDPLEFLKHICTAAKTHKSTKDKAKEEEAQPMSGAAAPGGATEEQRPYMMSTDGKKLELSTVISMPLEQIHQDHRGLAAKFQHMHKSAQRKHKAKTAARIAALEAAGCSKAMLDEWRQRSEGLELSMNPDGSYAKSDLDKELRLALKMANHYRGSAQLSTLLGRAKSEKRPGPEDQNDELVKVAQERAAKVSVGQNGSTNGSTH